MGFAAADCWRKSDFTGPSQSPQSGRGLRKRRGHAILPKRCRSLEKDLSDTATLSAKYRISIPKAVRNRHRWRPGQTFAFIPKGIGVLLAPVPDIQELKGVARAAKASGYRDRSDR